MEVYVYDSPVGSLTLRAEGDALLAVSFGAGMPEGYSPVLEQAVRELTEYFEGTRTAFTVPLLPAHSPFAQKVRSGMLDIPYGEVLPYALLAEAIGHPGAARAVGNACHNNPYPILIPCHRVVAAHSIGGFAGNEEIKKALLSLEQKKRSVAK